MLGLFAKNVEPASRENSYLPAVWAKCLLTALVVLLASVSVYAQAPQPDTLRTTSTLVLVPTRVQALSDSSPVYTLKAEDFALTDNGVPQRLHLEEASREPIAMVVLLQTGGAAPRQFSNYAGISTMLEYALGTVPYQISLITFDSQTEDRWPFSSDARNLHEAFTKPKAGDGGNAVLNAIEYGLDWFEDQHPKGRRLILLVSDRHFHASGDGLRLITEKLAKTNTTLYSLSFNAQTTYLKDELKHSSPPNPPLFFAPDHAALMNTFNLGRPLLEALSAMQRNTAEGLAGLSGGTYMPFGDRKSLELKLTAFANDLSSRYLLSFQPVDATAGLHSLQITLPRYPELKVTARTAYWRGDTAQ